VGGGEISDTALVERTRSELPQKPLKDTSVRLTAWLARRNTTPRLERGLVEVWEYLMVEPATTDSISISNNLDPSVLRATAPGVFKYRLLMQKQPGTNKNQYTVAVQIPDGVDLNETRPHSSNIEGQLALAGESLQFTGEVPVTRVPCYV